MPGISDQGVTLDESTFSRGQESTANLQTKLANTLKAHECYPSESIIYHYTGLGAARAICAGGFRRSTAGMAGPGIYFSTVSPADALGGEGGPRWPDPAFTEQMLHNNFGFAASEAGRLGKLDVVLVCKLSRDMIKDVPDRLEAKYVGDATLRIEHRFRYSSEFPQLSATYLRHSIVAGYVLKRIPSAEAPSSSSVADAAPSYGGDDDDDEGDDLPADGLPEELLGGFDHGSSSSAAKRQQQQQSCDHSSTAPAVSTPPVTKLAQASLSSLCLATGSLPASTKSLVESDTASDASPREVITLCLEGDYSAFDEAKERKIKRVLAGCLDVEVKAKQIRVCRQDVSRRVAAKIGTGRCRVRVEVDGDGWTKYSDDWASAGSGTDDDEVMSARGTSEVISESSLDSIDASLTELISTKYWPLSIEQTDVEVIWKGEGSVVLVISLPEPAGLLLHMLATQRLKPLLDEGIRCVKFGALVARLDGRDDMPRRVERLHAVENEAAVAIDRVQRQADGRRRRRAWAAAAREVSEAEVAAFEGALAQIIFAPDHFAAIQLGRSDELSDRDVDRAFKRASLRAHPDRNRKTRSSFDPVASPALDLEDVAVRASATFGESSLTKAPLRALIIGMTKSSNSIKCYQLLTGDGAGTTIARQYSEFRALRKTLAQSHKELPLLPPKLLIRTKSALARRQIGLSEWLSAVLQRPELSTDPAVRLFLGYAAPALPTTTEAEGEAATAAEAVAVEAAAEAAEVATEATRAEARVTAEEANEAAKEWEAELQEAQRRGDAKLGAYPAFHRVTAAREALATAERRQAYLASLGRIAPRRYASPTELWVIEARAELREQRRRHKEMMAAVSAASAESTVSAESAAPPAAVPPAAPSRPSDAAVQRLLVKVGMGSFEEAVGARELQWIRNDLDAEDAKVVAYVVAVSGSLVTLYLNDNKIGGEGAMALAASVASSSSLSHLNLDSNNICDDGARALAAGVATSSSLITLSLVMCGIGAAGAKALATGVAASGSLSTLDLRNNNIGDAGAKELAAGVAGSGSMADLRLNSNNIGDAGAKELAGAIFSCGSLAALLLGGNNIGDDGAKALAAAVAASRSLARLGLDNNNVGDDGARALATEVAASDSLSLLKELYVPSRIVNHAELLAACNSRSIELKTGPARKKPTSSRPHWSSSRHGS